MKTLIGIYSCCLKTIFFCIGITASTTTFAQTNQNNNEGKFKIIIEKGNGGINLVCLEGCAWTDLRIPLNFNQIQYINEFGMTDQKETENQIDPKLTDFLFTIVKTENGIQLHGVKGTSWTDLFCQDNRKGEVMIDQMGQVK